MDINTVIRTLNIAEKHMSTAKFNAFRTELRREYLTDQIAVRRTYLAQRVMKADIKAQFEKELPILEQQLAAL